MMPVIQINLFLYKMEAGKTECGNGQERGRERKREQIKGVGGRAEVRIRNDVG